MRGLTSEERALLTAPVGHEDDVDLSVVKDLALRGLLRFELSEPGQATVVRFRAQADLALRLDAAARAMGGVHG